MSNPLDLTAQGLVDPDLYYRTLAALFADDRFGSIVAGIIQTDPMTVGIKLPPIIRAVRELRPAKPVIVAGLDEGAKVPDHFSAELRKLGIPYFPSNERVLRALKRLNDLARCNFGESRAGVLPTPTLPAGGGVIPEYLAKRILAPLGVPFPNGAFVTTIADALDAAQTIGYPLAIKAQSPDLSHKSDAGGVILNLADAAALRRGWQDLHDNVGTHRPGLVLDGVLIEGMGERGVELIIGARNDPEWGPVVLAGFGGVTAEILQDVRLFVPDLPIDAIVSELYTLKSAAILRGFRGSPALDVDAVAQVIANVGRIMLAAPSILEIDLNPVIVHPQGKGVVALDALMLTSPRRSPAHLANTAGG